MEEEEEGNHPNIVHDDYLYTAKPNVFISFQIKYDNIDHVSTIANK